MQALPGAPGTARQGRTRTIVSTNDGGKATQPRAPGHGRPPAAQRAAGHGRLSADSGAPGADVPLATTAKAPGQHCLSAALQAPGHDVPLASTAGAPGHDRLSAAPIATVPSPAGLPRLRQEVLPRVPANPRILIYPHSHRLNHHSRRLTRHSRESGNPRPPVATGGLPGGYAPATRPPCSHTPTYRPSHSHHLSSASCHPSTAPPAVLLHRVYGPPPPTPRPRPAVPRCPLPTDHCQPPKWLRRQRLRYDAASCLVLLPGRAR